MGLNTNERKTKYGVNFVTHKLNLGNPIRGFTTLNDTKSQIFIDSTMSLYQMTMIYLKTILLTN